MNPTNPTTNQDDGPKKDPVSETDKIMAESNLPSSDDPTGDSPIEGLEPISLSLMGRLFGVPLLIIGSIVGGAIVIVLLFGGTTASPQRSIDELLQVLEANSGEKSLGVLLPREKQLWQTALELSKRLEKKDLELSAEEVDRAATRLAAMVRGDLAHLDSLPSFGEERVQQASVRSRRLEFAIHALGRTETPLSLEVMIEIVQGGVEPYVQVAMQELGNLHEVQDARRGVQPILGLLSTSQRPETLLTACTVLSVITTPGDSTVTEGLNRAMYAHDGDISWSAALSLARLGSVEGRSTLLDLLDRKFWESDQRYQITDSTGQIKRYAMPPGRIDAWLLAAIDASSHLDDSLLWEMIERLKSDPSLAVRGRAVQVWDQYESRTGSTMGVED